MVGNAWFWVLFAKIVSFLSTFGLGLVSGFASGNQQITTNKCTNNSNQIF
jgi:hypothetical protein